VDKKEIFILSFESIKERKVKSVLTILMVMVGSSLMIAVSGIGAGFTESFNKQTNNLAGNVIFISPAQPAQGGAAGGGAPPAAKITLNAAVQGRLESLPFVEEAIPSYQAQVTLQSGGKSQDYSVFSIDPTKLKTLTPTLEYVEGSSVSQNDPSAIIISDEVANPPGEDTPFATLGETVRLTYSFVDEVTGERDTEEKSFVVRAIMKPTGNPNVDNAVVINTQVGNTLFHKSGKFDSLIVVASSSELVSTIEEEIRKLYGNDIGITTVQAIIETVKELTSGINAFLMSIAIVSLIVGAVGIITTLYTSVVERTREIGTMKAIGAKNKHILALFLVEALLIGVFGATTGLGAGIAGGYILSAGFGSAGASGGPPLSPVFLPMDLARVWMISAGLSLLAGLFPALIASRLMPIMALKRD
jgi:putative ABC transport system permease protein